LNARANADKMRQNMIRSMQKTVAWGVSAVLVGALAVGYYVWRNVATHDTPFPAVDIEPERKPDVRGEPQIRYPIERVPREPGSAGAATAPLPALASSDAEVQDALVRLLGRHTFAQFVRPEQLVRHIVVTIDNLPRRTAAPRLWPIHPVPGGYIAPGAGDATVARANAARYAPYVAAFEVLDSRKLAAVYAYFYPLFQQAYDELGHPNVYFNDRLIEAIDIMLATPEVPEPIALVQPRVVHQFADPDLEALPSGQKILLRMGTENAARVKAKLTEIRQAVTGAGAVPAMLPAPGAASAPSAPAPSSTRASGG
jgi:hypothetical protein